jgi:hypothetical protein
VDSKTDSLPLWLSHRITAHQLLHVALLRAWEKGEKKRKLPGLKMSAQKPFDFSGRAYRFPERPTAVLTSLCLLKLETGVLQSGSRPRPRFASLPVVQQPFCQSPADPARWRSAVPPGYQVVGSSFALRASAVEERPPKAEPFLRVSSLLLHPPGASVWSSS